MALAVKLNFVRSSICLSGMVWNDIVIGKLYVMRIFQTVCELWSCKSQVPR